LSPVGEGECHHFLTFLQLGRNNPLIISGYAKAAGKIEEVNYQQVGQTS